MHPILFQIGPITFYSYGFFAALGILAAFFTGKRLVKLEGISERTFEKMYLYVIISGILGARIFFFIYNPFLLKDLKNIFLIWKGGLVWYGGLLFGVLTAIYLIIKYNLKSKVWKLADIAGICISIGLGFGRIGCTMAGCCYGIPYQGPFAIKFTDPHSLAPKGIYLFPSQPISSLANFLIFFILYFLYKRKRFDGQIFSLFLIFYGTFRFLIEFFRMTPKIFLGLSENQILSLIFTFVGIIIYLKRSKKSQNTKSI